MTFKLPHGPAPRAEIRPLTSIHHGIELSDNYAWLKADNWRDVMRDPDQLPADIRAYLEAENTYYEAAMEDTKSLQDELFDELKARVKQDDSTVPSPDGAYAYASKYNEGDEYPIFTRTHRDGSNEEVLFDGPVEAKEHEYFALGLMSHSSDHKRLAWSVDTNGSEFHHLKIRDIATGKDGTETVSDVGGFQWCADNESFAYVHVDQDHRPNKVFFKRPGEDAKLIYEESDARFYVGLGKSLDGKYITIHTGQNDEDEVYLLPSDNLDQAPQLVAPRRAGHEYDVEVHGQTLYITTNSNGAANYRVVTAEINDPREENWQELIPHRDEVLIVSVALFKNYMVRLERENALPRIVIRELVTGVEHAIAFEEEAYSLGMMPGYEFDTATLRFGYSSPSTPSQVWDYDMNTRTRVLRKEQEIPSGHDSSNYVVRRLQAPARDGELVPLTVLHRKDMPLDGSAPCLLYGYGSYGAGMTAGFATNRLSLVDRGFVYVTAHIRGGDEKGRHWYEQTKKAGKHKTFDDFIDSGRYLAQQGFTSQGSIIAMGGSAGGLLMGAVVNQAPELFSGIIAQVPFVDVLNTMLDASLPLTPGEWSQWGNPIESMQEYEIIASYSPYDNISPQAYPPIFALSGLTDPRVQYWEPSKWVARLREVTQGASPVLLKTNMGSGHFGKTGRFAYLEEVALVYAFALKCAGKA